MKKSTLQSNRLESLDILRGFDLFCLVALVGIFHPLARALDSETFNSFMWAFTHVNWEGFSSWDLVMPLFMFMSGITIPFALSKYKTADNKLAIYRKIFKRVILLWILGMITQGNLLGLDPDRVYLYTNTLQAIAAGYLIASLLFLNTRTSVQIGVATTLLLLYWFLMEFITIENYGGGDYTQKGNLAEWFDRTVLGRFRDGAYAENGTVVFYEGYHYTWILSILNFGVTVITGMFAGSILKSKLDAGKKWKYLVYIGVSMVALGWFWGMWHPVIKTIWTSSMTLVSSGYCFLLMALFYYVIDYKGHQKYAKWLKIYGMNSIVAYVVSQVVNFRGVADSVFFGLKPYLGDFYPVLLATSQAAIIFFILYVMYKRNIFVKV